MAPAARGKQEFKDCLIIEQYLALGRRIQSLGVPLVFVTSNSEDYCGGGTRLAAPLNEELPAAGITWCSVLNWAEAVLHGTA